jgi:type IV pilus assembly protein PilY1
MGRGIFIVDAITGSPLWRATGMTYAVPADITLVDRDFDGYIDRLYAADLGGNVWRVDLEPKGGDAVPAYDRSTWKLSKIAAIGGSGTTKRKMFFPPDVVLTKNYDAVVVSTGDREHPLRTNDANNIVNRFYMIKDTSVGMSVAADWAVVTDDTSATSDTQPASLFNATSVNYDKSGRGFYISFAAGEKGVNAPTTVGGVTYFGTNQPKPPQACSANLGTARGYGVNFVSGKKVLGEFDGGGLLPSPVFGIVTVKVNGKDQQLPFLIGGVGGTGVDSRSGLGAQKPPITIKVKKQRTYWNREIDR